MRTALVGMVYDAAALGILTDDPHAEGGKDGEECEDEDGIHGGDSKRRIEVLYNLGVGFFSINDLKAICLNV